jgi:RNA polymerase sigma-70 factor (ECF subfamily)
MMARKAKSRSFVSFDDDENLFEEKYAADWNSIPYKDAENEELKKILDKAIQNLSPDYRLVFLLRDVEGLSTEETAQVTELSIPAVKSRLHRARAFLRQEINEAFSR